jgi:hypothetical protein
MTVDEVNNLSEKAKKQRKNKADLVRGVKLMLMDNMYDYQDFIADLLEEALYTRTQKQLKELL